MSDYTKVKSLYILAIVGWSKRSGGIVQEHEWSEGGQWGSPELNVASTVRHMEVHTLYCVGHDAVSQNILL